MNNMNEWTKEWMINGLNKSDSVLPINMWLDLKVKELDIIDY